MIKTETYQHFVPYAILYFFLNNLLLPEGLLYTAILSPIFLYYLYRESKIHSMLNWGILLLIPIPFQLYAGVDAKSYLLSTFLVFTAWIFLFSAIKYALITNEKQESIFRTILLINSVLILIALIILPLQSIRELMWYEIPISPNVPGFPRLKLFAYEPSYYALLLSPVFLFYLLKVITGNTKHSFLLLLAVGLPLLLSLSFGVLGAMILSLFLGTLVFAPRLPKIYWKYFLYSTFFVFTLLLIIWLIWPSNPVYLRIANIFSGEDTSAKGRLFNSFWFAFDLIKEQNFLMGIGPGQVKILAHDMIINYYKYSGEYAEIVRIPNSMGEMLAVYGVYGFLLKLFFEIYFFVRLKVYTNFYNLVLFLFIFIYQFTGSFVINVAEIGTWIITFNTRFSMFNVNLMKNKST